MEIKVNGKSQGLDTPGVTIFELLKANGVEKPELVSVQLNGAFVQNENFKSVTLKDSDEVDYLFFMGGGR